MITMIAALFISFFERDLNKVKEELMLYTSEKDLWKTEGSIKNSAGNLALHIAGNLKHFIGAVFGKSGYMREREKEFSVKNVPLADVLRQIEEARLIVIHTLSGKKDEQLTAAYPEEFLGQQTTVLFVLTQLAVHLNYHLGQINYHRRFISGKA